MIYIFDKKENKERNIIEREREREICYIFIYLKEKRFDIDLIIDWLKKIFIIIKRDKI